MKLKHNCQKNIKKHSELLSIAVHKTLEEKDMQIIYSSIG